MSPLPRSFYARPVGEVARDLLGCVLVRRLDGDELRGEIVEVEAYGGADDAGSHAFRGRTRRNEVMFGPPGHLYVYRIYHFHTCMNVVCEGAGIAGAVLIRALIPLSGLDVMERNRGGRPVRELCNGPAKLCQALEISMEQNGTDLQGPDLWIEPGSKPDEISASTRVGLTRGADLPWRYFLPGNSFVSPGRPAR